VLGEERNGMFTCLDALLDVVDLSILTDKVGFAQFESLILLLIFVVFDDLDEIFV